MPPPQMGKLKIKGRGKRASGTAKQEQHVVGSRRKRPAGGGRTPPPADGAADARWATGALHEGEPAELPETAGTLSPILLSWTP